MKIKDIINLISEEEVINLCDKHGFIQEITKEDRKLEALDFSSAFIV